ncbi:hypothetical protein [Haloferula sargassicola]|uniref:Secreted protein n=1 Tax=Haloferula sargassicola TaxID=490096 RepID=A0ABP9UU57_9BACT
MKHLWTFFLLVTGLAGACALFSCEKPADDPMTRPESPATEVAPSEPVPQPADTNEVNGDEQ